MPKTILLIFLSLTVINCEYFDKEQSILQQISDGNSECNNIQLFGSFEFENVPQFGAMCNIQIPDTKMDKILLNNNVIPILCMGIFDASLRLCKSAMNDTTPFKDVLPPTIDKFNQLFIRLSSEEYSSLDKFCSITVKKCSIREPANNKTEFWWMLLYQQLNEKASCMDICRTNEKNRVHPLCSYIIWSNGVVINYNKNKKESLGTLGLADDAEDEISIKEPDYSIAKNIIGAESISRGNMTSAISAASGSELLMVDKELSSVTSLVQGVEVIHVADATVNTNRTSDKLVEGDPTSGGQNPDLSVGITETSATGKSISKADEIKSTANSNNNSESSILVSQMKPTNENNANKSSLINKPPVVDTTLNVSLPDINASEGLKAVADPSNEPATDQDGNYVEVPPEQAISSNKDIGMSPPFEDIVFGDGDDVDSDQEGPERTTPTQKGPNKLAAEPDKVYSEGDRKVLMVDPFVEAEDSHFFTYFICMSVLTIMAYLAFHNKKKLIALAVEGRRTRHTRQRPNSSFYSKLDCNLEEAMISNSGKASVTHVLY